MSELRARFRVEIRQGLLLELRDELRAHRFPLPGRFALSAYRTMTDPDAMQRFLEHSRDLRGMEGRQ